MRKLKLIKNLKVGEIVDDIFVVKFKKPVQEYSRGYKFELRIGDSSGEIMLKFWGDNNKEFIEEIYNSIKKDSIIFIKGIVNQYNRRLEISVNNPTAIKKCQDYSPEDFILTTEKNIEIMFGELMGIIKSIETPLYKQILNSFFDDSKFVKKFKFSPAAMYKHHGWLGGLLEHTLNVVNLCRSFLAVHKDMDKDLLLTGAILHDLGKIKEFEVLSSIKVSKLGMLKGHIILGSEIISKRMDELGIKEEDGLKLIHIILSHHGKMEYGSPKLPAFPEAIAVYYADDIDAKLTQMIKTKKEAITEDDYVFTKDFGNIYLN
ncbi:MAG: HD domain-containing protein [Nanoarchaeota archaeon]|nr:HD domain-containing protein [Nanoarchaeota archaeon]